MGWMMDTYSMTVGHSVPGVVTGKPLEIGGSEGRTEATARGVSLNILGASKVLGLDPAKTTVAIQGYGNVGSFAHKLIARAGYKVVAVSDVKGGIFNAKGLVNADVYQHHLATGSVVGFPDADNISNEELLALDVDILVPAALENQITKDNAPKVKAKVIAEAANGPTTPKADLILNDKNVFMIPDILCNAGGVTVSYFEWVQDLQAHFWDEAAINQNLQCIMDRSFQNVYQVSLREKCNMRLAAYIVAVEKVAQAIKIRGIFP